MHTILKRLLGKQIKKYIMENNDINDIIIVGDFNQDIRLNGVQKFFTELGIQDVHSKINSILSKLIDKININKS